MRWTPYTDKEWRLWHEFQFVRLDLAALDRKCTLLERRLDRLKRLEEKRGETAESRLERIHVLNDLEMLKLDVAQAERRAKPFLETTST